VEHGGATLQPALGVSANFGLMVHSFDSHAQSAQGDGEAPQSLAAAQPTHLPWPSHFVALPLPQGVSRAAGT
jgi:hypothetical protein